MDIPATYYFIGIVVIALPLIRKYIQGGQYRKTNRIDNKVVIITGSNTGIGKETALDLAKRGAKIYLACRSVARAEAAREEIIMKSNNKNVFVRELDLSSLKSVRNFAQKFLEEETRLDILINNAGIMACRKMNTADGFEMQIGTNHMGHFLLTNLLLDLIKTSAPSRIINVSSLAHLYGKINKEDLNSEKSYSEVGAYMQSKLANVLFTKELARRLQGTGVTVNALHPGTVDTELNRHLQEICFIFHPKITKPLTMLFLKTSKSGAQTTLYAALDPDLDDVTGKYFSDCKYAKVNRDANNQELAEWLWDTSVQWTENIKIRD